jgi:hypothetical protein
MSGLLEVGQANYNTLQQECFSVGYQALYWMILNNIKE